MKYSSLILTSLFCALLGIIIFAIQHEWIIISIPAQTNEIAQQPTEKKIISLYFWRNDNFICEQESLLWDKAPIENIHRVISCWLSTLEAEQYSIKKVSLETAILAPNNILYISFDRHPFGKEFSTVEKLLWLEGLLKTLKETGISIHAVQFLVHHKPLVDGHIDCSRPWPIEGFLGHTVSHL